MKTFYIFLIALFTTKPSIIAQVTSDTNTCYPSGIALYSVKLSEDFQYVCLQSLLYNFKVFELATGNLVAVSEEKNWKTFIKPYTRLKDELRAKDPFTIKVNHTQTYDDTYQVFDSLNNLIKEVATSGAAHYAFNSKNGDLVISNKKVYLYRIGQKDKQIAKQEKTGWNICTTDYAKFSPDGKYLVSAGYVTNLENKTVLANVFDFNTRYYDEFDVHFSEDGKNFTVPIYAYGLKTFELTTGKLVDSVPIPIALPALKDYKQQDEGFRIIMLPNGKDFIYWLKYYSKLARVGMAFYVKDGIGLSLCDPNWAKESWSNWLVQLDNASERIKKEKIEAEKLRTQQEAYRLAHPEKVTENKPKNNVIIKYENINVDCNYCKKTGKIYYEKLAIGGGTSMVSVDYYGKATYSTSSGTAFVTCSACNGKGYIKTRVAKK